MYIHGIGVIWLVITIPAISDHPMPKRISRPIKMKQILHNSNFQDPVFDPDNGGGLTFLEDKPRIDKFARRLLKLPDAQGYIFAYGGKIGPAGEARQRLMCIRTYLQNSYQILPSRLVMIDGGYRSEIEVELFTIRPGDPKPEPFPTIKSSGVRTLKQKKRGRRCY